MINHIIDRIKGKIPSGRKRSSKWRSVRRDHLKKYPMCNVCRGTKKLVVHHVIPFHVNPKLELVESNLTTLCESKRYGVNCHLLVGHLGNWKRYNDSFLRDCYTWRNKITGRS